jgi:anti-anti-sigma factor
MALQQFTHKMKLYRREYRVDIRIENRGNGAILHLAGQFDMTTHATFNRAYSPLLSSGTVGTLHLNLSEVDYIDSSALGMLLLLQSKAAKKNTSLSLSGCRNQVMRVFTVANFHKTFKIV